MQPNSYNVFNRLNNLYSIFDNDIINIKLLI